MASSFFGGNMTVDELRKFLESIGLNIQIPGYGQLLLSACNQATEEKIRPKPNKNGAMKLRGKGIIQYIVDEPSKEDTARFFDYARKVMIERRERDGN